MADIVTSKIWVDGEKGVTATKMNQIISGAAIQPEFYTAKPTASTVNPTDVALILQSGAYAQAQVSTLGGAATQAQIWSTRLRSFNAIGNPNFEVDQRNAGASVGLLGNWATDRWVSTKVGTMGGSLQQLPFPDAVVPGTSFRISRCALRLTLTVQEAALAVGDYHILNQSVEGPFFRELSLDVHSVSLLVRSSVAGLNFGLVLKDPLSATKTLAKLCTIPSANTWTLISLPNLPVWPSGNFTSVPGANGYQIGITLACGSTFMSPANDTWQTGSFWGAVGQSNFYGQPVNSTFDIAFVQHEPGSVCSTLMDKPFSQNLDECLRYYQKTYDYDVAVGTPSTPLGTIQLFQNSTTALNGTTKYFKPMAKIPTVVTYNHGTGAANSVRHVNGSDYAVTAVANMSKGGFSGVVTGTMPAVVAGAYAQFHYTADTGW